MSPHQRSIAFRFIADEARQRESEPQRMGAMWFSEGQIADLKARIDCAELAQSLGARLRRSGRKLIGACPICGGGRSATRFEVEGENWVCAVCSDGGDVLALVQRVRGCSFPDAVEFLGGARALSPEEAERLRAARAAREAKRQRDAEVFREQERKRAWAIWDFAKHGTFETGLGYFARRGLDPIRSGCLRLADSLDYFHGFAAAEDGRRGARRIHKGSALLAAIIGPDGRFAGLHQTWIDCATSSGKAEIFDPETGEALPAKKVRGSKAAGRIELIRAKAPQRLFLGEGIETVLSVATALRRMGRLSDGDAFWSSVDLGNLGGPATEAIAHPRLKHANGHAWRLPGPQPDLAAPAIPVPESVEELVLLGDGDSEPFLTQTTLSRAAARYARPGRMIRIAFADQGCDFNDMLRLEEA